jgi:hypothetical protein
LALLAVLARRSMRDSRATCPWSWNPATVSCRRQVPSRKMSCRRRALRRDRKMTRNSIATPLETSRHRVAFASAGPRSAAALSRGGGGADAAVEGLPWKGRSTASCASGTDRKSQATWPTKTCPWLTGGPQDPGIPEMKRSVHSRTMHETVSGRLLSVLGCVLRPSGVLSWNVVAPGRPGENQPHPLLPYFGRALFSGPTGRLDRDFAFPKGEIVLAGRELDASGR